MRANAVLWAGLILYWTVAAGRARRKIRLGAPGKVMHAEPIRSRVRHMTLLSVGFLAIFGEAFAFDPLTMRVLPDAAWVGVVGNALTALGVGFAIWARMHLGLYWSGRISIRAGHRLIQSGPYRLVRHPIYTGVIVGALGSAVALGQLRGLGAILVVAGAYLWKMRAEERALRLALGREYDHYHERVKGLIPYVL